MLDVPREFASLGADLGTKFGETGIGRKLGAGIRSTLGGTINPETARTLQAGLQGGTEQTNFTKPQNTAQKVGFGAEKVAEFFVPGGAAGKLGKLSVRLVWPLSCRVLVSSWCYYESYYRSGTGCRTDGYARWESG